MPLKVLGRNEIQEGGGGKFLLYHPPQILNSAPGRGVFVFNTPTRSVAGDLPCPAHLGGRDCCHQAPLSAAVNCPGEKQCHINKQPQPWSCFGKGWGYWVVKVATFKDYLWFLISKCTSYVPTSHSIFSNKPLLSLRWSCTRREASTPRLRLGVLELWLCILERSQWWAEGTSCKVR